MTFQFSFLFRNNSLPPSHSRLEPYQVVARDHLKPRDRWADSRQAWHTSLRKAQGAMAFPCPNTHPVGGSHSAGTLEMGRFHRRSSFLHRVPHYKIIHKNAI